MKQITTTDTNLELAKWLGGAAAGALLMYMLDPDRGGTRRAQSVAAVRGAGTRTSDALGKAWRGAGARLGAAADAASDTLASAGAEDGAGKLGSRLSRMGQAASDMLDDSMSRAKSAISRASDAAADAGTQATRVLGRASTGAADASDDGGRKLAGLGERVASALRGASGGAGSDRSEDSWTPTVRNSALLGGGLLALTGLMRRSPMGLILGLAGAALLARGATNQPLGKLVKGRSLSLDQTVDIEKSIHIDASPEEVYDLFANYENFPHFMSHVVEVRDLGRRRSHWTVKGPGGSQFEWNSVLTEQNRPHRLAWRSEPGAEIPQTGSVQLERRRGGTDVTVRLSYTPPAGLLGHGLATLLGSDPKSQMDEDLAHMKAAIERGAVPRDTAQPRTGSRFLH